MPLVRINKMERYVMMPEFSERSFSRVIGLPARVDQTHIPFVEALSDSRYQRRAAFGFVPCPQILRVGHGSGTFATMGCAFCCTAESPGNIAPSTTVRPTTTLCYAEPDSLSIA
jgi:hypothetical protein